MPIRLVPDSLDFVSAAEEKSVPQFPHLPYLVGRDLTVVGIEKADKAEFPRSALGVQHDLHRDHITILLISLPIS